MASMLLSAETTVAERLLLLSYPLHPPNKPEQKRTAHLPALRKPTLFVQGTKDPFGTIEEIEAARQLVPDSTDLLVIQGGTHTLPPNTSVIEQIVERFVSLGQ
jgi:hypothetical protein